MKCSFIINKFKQLVNHENIYRYSINVVLVTPEEQYDISVLNIPVEPAKIYGIMYALPFCQ